MNLNNLQKDKIYNYLYNSFGEEYIKNAGYFDFEDENKFSSLTDEEIMDTLFAITTPLPNPKYDYDETSVILLSTGCYNPMHDDHINMMYSADIEMRNRGYNVIGAYFAPDHDEYVKSKSEKYWNIHYRTKYMIDKIKEHDLNDRYFVDTWSAMYLKNDVNFTTIYRRLELYIEKYYGRKIPIYYVCGSDRAEFSHTFRNKSIVVNRDYNVESIDFINKLHHECIFVRPHNIFGDSSLSSTEIRKTFDFSKKIKKNLHIRLVDGHHIYDRHQLLNNEFNNIYVSSYIKQKEIFYQFSHNKNVISLDRYLKNDHELNVSRYYNFGGANFLEINNRIGSKQLKEQIKKIPQNKDYFLFDDDSVTGYTFKTVKSFLKENGYTINGSFTLINNESEICEILDYHDFYLGDENGLAILAPDNTRFRVPYLYPFVNITQRASIYNDPIGFSKGMWKLIFKETPENDTIGDNLKYKFLKYVGFDKEMKVRDSITKIISIL
jgi:hypothetical protein